MTQRRILLLIMPPQRLRLPRTAFPSITMDRSDPTTAKGTYVYEGMSVLEVALFGYSLSLPSFACSIRVVSDRHRKAGKEGRRESRICPMLFEYGLS